MHITFILPVLADSYYQRRVEKLTDHGVQPTILGFQRNYYQGKSWQQNVIKIGSIDRGKYRNRFFALLKSIFPVRKYSKGTDVIYCFNLETLLIGWAANLFRNSKTQMVYDVADIWPYLIKKGMAGSVLRSVEKFLVKRTAMVVVTSSAYIDGYFHGVQKLIDTRYHVIENKVEPETKNHTNNLPSPAGIDEEQTEIPIRIGYFGVIRCRHSLQTLQQVVEEGRGKFLLYLRGIFIGMDHLKSDILKSEYVEYGGPYISPDDLPELYKNIDLTWAAFYHAQSNVRWARATRFYQACYFQSPMIVQYNTQDGSIAQKLNLGLSVDIANSKQASRKILGIGYEDLERWKKNIEQVPQEFFVDQNENQKLFNKIKECTAPATSSVFFQFLKTAGKILRTVQHLKLKQILYQIYYRIHQKRKLKRIPSSSDTVSPLAFFSIPEKDYIQNADGDNITVKLLNRTMTFSGKIHWNENKFGKLWNYNLQYASFINQHNLPVTLRKNLLSDLYKWLYDGMLVPEPYPASLRIMNVIRFLSHPDTISDSMEEIQKGVFSELHFLENRPEYHLLGNHLLENSFALLMGGHYFNNPKWIKGAESILNDELEVQILNDGGHFERSPMYHNIILFRLLEAICYLPEHSAIRKKLIPASEKMFSWIKKMTFTNGMNAHFNDSVDGVALQASFLIKAGNEMGLKTDRDIPLSDSGFRKFKTETIELIADVHGISPSCQPGHAHADTHSFVLHIKNEPFIVDPGVSTYNINERREWERSTAAHNTVTVCDMNTAEMWAAFRVGKRPDVTITEEDKTSVTSELTCKTNVMFADITHVIHFLYEVHCSTKL
jgi:hypothetical protein